MTGVSAKRSQRDEHIDSLKRFLWDEGPHKASDLAEQLGVSESGTRDLLSLMRHEGLVEPFQRDGTTYWMYAAEEELEAEA